LPGYLSIPTAIGPVGLLFDASSKETPLLGIALPAQTEAATIKHLGAIARRHGRGAELERLEIADAPAPVREAARLLAAHLAGDAVDLSGIALADRGMSTFRREVYAAARRIPRGTLATYAELARAAGSPHGARAVGRAMATNPWPLVVPCHRVVGSEGDLTGFSAPGGTRTKAELLRIEGYVPPGSTAPRGTPKLPEAQASLPFAPEPPLVDSRPDGRE
jgi:methylated-DNA-[protein]-cysteine S-methyltransferase